MTQNALISSGERGQAQRPHDVVAHRGLGAEPGERFEAKRCVLALGDDPRASLGDTIVRTRDCVPVEIGDGTLAEILCDHEGSAVDRLADPGRGRKAYAWAAADVEHDLGAAQNVR